MLSLRFFSKLSVTFFILLESFDSTISLTDTFVAAKSFLKLFISSDNDSILDFKELPTVDWLFVSFSTAAIFLVNSFSFLLISLQDISTALSFFSNWDKESWILFSSMLILGTFLLDSVRLPSKLETSFLKLTCWSFKDFSMFCSLSLSAFLSHNDIFPSTFVLKLWRLAYFSFRSINFLSFSVTFPLTSLVEVSLFEMFLSSFETLANMLFSIALISSFLKNLVSSACNVILEPKSESSSCFLVLDFKFSVISVFLFINVSILLCTFLSSSLNAFCILLTSDESIFLSKTLYLLSKLFFIEDKFPDNSFRLVSSFSVSSLNEPFNLFKSEKSTFLLKLDFNSCNSSFNLFAEVLSIFSPLTTSLLLVFPIGDPSLFMPRLNFFMSSDNFVFILSCIVIFASRSIIFALCWFTLLDSACTSL